MFEYVYSSFLLSAPGVATITLSGVITSAPLAVAAPLNMVSTIVLNVSTMVPPVIYSAAPFYVEIEREIFNIRLYRRYLYITSYYEIY